MTQQTCLQCDAADVACCVAQQGHLLCGTADMFCCAAQQTRVLCDDAEASGVWHGTHACLAKHGQGNVGLKAVILTHVLKLRGEKRDTFFHLSSRAVASTGGGSGSPRVEATGSSETYLSSPKLELRVGRETVGG